jgi:hypothetical protein
VIKDLSLDKNMRDSNDITSLSPAGNRSIALETCTKIRKPDLRNILNFLNFQDEDLLCIFRHAKTGSPITLRAKPDPCIKNTLICRWSDREKMNFNLRSYLFEHIFIKDGKNLIVIKSDAINCDSEGFCFELPDFGFVSRYRSIMRYQGADVTAKVLQNGALYEGVLADFSPLAFRVEIRRTATQSFYWINTSRPLMLLLEKDEELLYSGECTLIRQDKKTSEIGTLVLSPCADNMRRFPAKKYRSIRHNLNPPPSVMFSHPLSGKLITLQSVDVSSSGLSVEELHGTSVLVPGMIIHDLNISIAGNHSIKCIGQVLYRYIISPDNGNSIARCGIAFLDMAIEDQFAFSSLLHRAVDHRTMTGNSVDIDELWKLFFTSGFIYPEKYASIWPNKEEFKNTYMKLYHQSPAIARHFIFQERGRLYAHMSMIRFYPNSWLIHHHVGGKEQRAKAGVMVLDQVGFYVKEFHSLISTHMNFVICYYREENRFPRKVFGGVAEQLKNPKASSLDVFAYISLSQESEPKIKAPLFEISPVSLEDLVELEGFYENQSGGLMLDALDLKPGFEERDRCVNQEFELHGFKRSRTVWSLKKERELCAVLTVTVSDLGLNLSNLTNCIHLFLLEKIPFSSISPILSDLLSAYPHGSAPVLVYPGEYVDNKLSVYDKKYTLWILNLENSDDCFQSFQKTFKRSHDEHGNQEEQ